MVATVGMAAMLGTVAMAGMLGTAAMAVIGEAGAGVGLASVSLLDPATTATVVDAGPTTTAATFLVTGCTTS
jgi:hypothetical protein